MAKTLNPDARAAVSAAQKGNCRDAMKYLYDASPHVQTAECNTAKAQALQADFRHANLIVAGLCTRNERKTSGRKGGGQYDFQGAGRRKRKRSR